MSDTLRADYLGCYGNRDVHTPNIDAFARCSMRFTRAYPESLPTIPVRRALHTGRRAYPFRNYRPVKWDMVYLPGWEPMDNVEDTLAENLVAAGYHTGFVTDTLPYFAPGLNFTRGFYQWEFIRGQQQDKWRSPFSVSDERLARYGDPAELRKTPYSYAAMHLANTAHVRSEQDTSTARTFQWAMDVLEDNRVGPPFYLLVDCFDPHELWEAPEKYYQMYGPAIYRGRRILHCWYGSAEYADYTSEEIEYVKAHYCGLVSLVDTWFGKLIDKMDALGLSDHTMVIFTSDHGTNFCDNPHNVIGKPEYSMYPGLMHLPLLVRTPDETGAGQTCDELVYNLDVTATIYDLTGAKTDEGVDGHSLLPLVVGEGEWPARAYVTCRYGHSLCYIDDATWVLTDIDGQPQDVFDLKTDPLCQEPLDVSSAQERFAAAWKRLLADAGGDFPDYRDHKQTDALGREAGKRPAFAPLRDRASLFQPKSNKQK